MSLMVNEEVTLDWERRNQQILRDLLPEEPYHLLKEARLFALLLLLLLLLELYMLKLIQMQYVVSLAVTEAVKNVCDNKGFPYIDVKIKWPNDLYLNGLKVGGIFCTSTYRSKKFHVSVGVGLNVENKQPTTCLNAVLKHISPASDLLKREEILEAFFHKLEKFFDLFMKQGFKSLEELYYMTWLHSEQRVIVEEKMEDQVVQNVVTIQVG